MGWWATLDAAPMTGCAESWCLRIWSNGRMNVSWPFLGILKSQINERCTPLDPFQSLPNRLTTSPTILLCLPSIPILTHRLSSWPRVSTRRLLVLTTLVTLTVILNQLKHIPLHMRWGINCGDGFATIWHLVDFPVYASWSDPSGSTVLGYCWRGSLETGCYAWTPQWWHPMGLLDVSIWGVEDDGSFSSQWSNSVVSPGYGDCQDGVTS